MSLKLTTYKLNVAKKALLMENNMSNREATIEKYLKLYRINQISLSEFHVLCSALHITWKDINKHLSLSELNTIALYQSYNPPKNG